MRKWKVYLLHHTHFDIGYTHTQEEVFRIQMRNLERAMALVDLNRHRPEAACFRWNPEVTFPVMKWLEQAQPKEVDRFIAMVREGFIGLDGFYAGMLTGLCRPEELAMVFSQKSQLEKLTGVTIDSAMITDIPGWNWGLVSALEENGIRYLSSGPNGGDRIGYTLKAWGDKPFYWISPSGQERVLLWVHGKGYAWFHTGMNYERRMKNKLTRERIQHYLRSLERSGYPYNSVILRYNIGADNGPADDHLSQIVEEWNAKFQDIQLIISTTSKAMAEFERDYGLQIPEYRGDFTPYWEDGACSTARETAIAREASERLTQAKTLFALTGAKSNSELESRAWENVLLFNEHTWGAYNSISQPDHEFAKSQWAWKRDRALQADANVRMMLKDAAEGEIEFAGFYSDELTQTRQPFTDHARVTVYNTHNWIVSQMVEANTAFDHVQDADGNPVPSQRLANGRLAFCAKDLPPLGSRQYIFSEGLPFQTENISRVDNLQLSNGRVKIKIDAKTGAVESFIHARREYVNRTSDDFFNGYVLVPIKTPIFKQREDLKESVNIEAIDTGPLRSTIRISRRAARTIEYVTEISLDAYSDEVQVSNFLNRPVSRQKEGIHFSFPFDLPNGTIRYDCAWGVAQLNLDQLPGANHNFITASRWVDVSDEKSGMCCVLRDAPIFKSGPLNRDPWRWGPPELCGWKKQTKYNGTIYSYVMNNYWQTNYKADQPGWTLFRYVFKPHGSYSAMENYRAAAENSQSLIVSFTNNSAASVPIPSHKDVGVSSLEATDDGFLMRLVNIGDTNVETTLELGNSVIPAVQMQVVSARKQENLVGNRLKLARSETIVIFIANKNSN